MTCEPIALFSLPAKRCNSWTTPVSVLENWHRTRTAPATGSGHPRDPAIACGCNRQDAGLLVRRRKRAHQPGPSDVRGESQRAFDQSSPAVIVTALDQHAIEDERCPS
jgi:hypothetical protein